MLQAPEHCVIAHVYGELPPLAARLILYGFDTVAVGSGLGELIVIEVVFLGAASASMLPTLLHAVKTMSGNRPDTFVTFIPDLSSTIKVNRPAT